MCSGMATSPGNYNNRALTLCRSLLPLLPARLRKMRGQGNNCSPKLQVCKEFPKPLSRSPQQSKTLGNPKLGGVGEGRKNPLIIKCCLCKMKNRIIPSGHNSPGKPSTYLTRQEAELMHGGGAAAVHANSTSNPLCEAHSPRMAFHARSNDTPISLQLLQDIFASPTSAEMNIFFILPSYLPCLYLPPLLAAPTCIINLSLHSLKLL